MKRVRQPRCFSMAAGLVFLLGINPCTAAEPVVAKTFEAERIAEYTITDSAGDAIHRLRVTKRKSNGAIWIKYTPPQPVDRFEEVAPPLTRLIQAADALDPGRISSMTAYEYFDCQEMILDVAAAFKKNGVWKQFLKKRDAAATPPYAAIIEQLRRADVFDRVEEVFKSVGYCAWLVGYEKLAVRTIGPVIEAKRLAELGLMPTQEIPVPMVLHFRLAPLDPNQPCGSVRAR